MINVSTQLKKESLTNRNYYVTANVTLSNGTTLKLGKKDFYLSGNSLVDSADSGDFPVGVAIEKTASLSLVNDDGRFDNYNFNGARFVIFLNLQLSDKLETIKRGTYIVSKKPATASEISLSLLDKMHNADKAYDSNLSFPCTVKELLSECCQQCGITLGDTMFPNADFQIQKAPSNATYRTVIGMCAGIAGGNARIDENDLLRIITFDKNFISASVGTLSTTDYHTLSSIQNLQYDVDDIIVTGVKYVEDEIEYMSGQDGYVITIDNQLLSGNAQAIIEAIGSQLIGLRMRPFSCDGIANGYATFGDPVEFTNVKKHTFKSFVTDLEFTFGGSTSWSCNAKSAEEDVSEFIGGQQAAVEQSKKDIEKKLSAYDVKLKQMNELAANTLGFFYTEEKQEDGSVIAYRHDKPTLADSKVIYKTGVDGFFLSIDGGQTWKAGFDSNGDAVLNILYAIGIQSEWINTRGFTAKDNNGDVTFRVDADTGHVDIVANSFQLKGKTIQEIAKESAKNYVDSVVIDGIDVSTQYFYAYDPTLENAPASEWTDADTKDKHLNDIFYNTSTKKMFRFVKIDDTYSWESFDDPDIKAALDAASTAQDTADGKRRVFLVTPTPPYDEGDMWVTSTTDGKGEIKICKTPRKSGAFSSADWISPSYVDSDDVNNAISEYDTSLGQPEIFSKLTNNGKNKGIYIQDGELYINASYILSGVLAGKLINGKGLNVTDKDGQVTLKIDDDGNVMIAAKTLTIGGKDVEDIAGDTIDEKIKKAIPLVIQLSSEYQAIPVNADGSYSSFPRCEVKVQVFYGESDVTSEAAISYSTENITGTWSSGTHTYSVKSLSEDIGWVDFSTTYNEIIITKRFNIAKQYAGGNGTNGKDATVYYLECETTTIKRCSNSSGGYDYSPSPLVFHLYSQTGAEERKQNISGRWTFEYTEDGSTWNAISGTGVGIDMKFSAWDRITNRTTAIRCTVGNSSGVILGMLSVSVLADAEVTREAVFNALTDNGDRQLIAYGSDGKLYINGEYIKSKTITADLIDVNTLDAIVAKIGGFVVGSASIHTSGRNSMTSTVQGIYIGTNGFSVYKDASNYFNMNTSVGMQIKGGTIKLGNVTLAEASDKKSLSVKYGMQVHTQRSSGEFTDGSGEFKLINLTTVSSGYQTLCIASNIVYKLSSSSKRYKNHVRNMDSSEADKLLKVPVVWFQYKKGYLKEGDSFEGKPVPGFYAEDVYKQYPEGVIFNEDGQIEDWNYRTMIPAMMKVIQNQNERINDLYQRISRLEEQLESRNK